MRYVIAGIAIAIVAFLALSAYACVRVGAMAEARAQAAYRETMNETPTYDTEDNNNA